MRTAGLVAVRYPPYSTFKEKLIRFLMR